MRLSFWLVLVIGERRANPSGSAVCCLAGASRRPKVMGGLVAGIGAVLLGGFWVTSRAAWPASAVLLLLVWWYWPMIRNGLAAIRARRVLHQCRPPGRAVTVHTVASVEPGAGRGLLAEVMAEADAHGWLLLLDAANERLAGYYAQFGFEATGPPVPMPWGEANVPMARRAIPLGRDRNG